MQTNTKDQVYAGFFVRLTAFLVDMIIVNAALLVIRIPMWILSLNSPDNVLVRDFIFQYSIVDIVCYLLTVLYFTLLTYYTGATLGKKLFQLRVVSTEDRKMTFFEVLYRESIGRFLSGVIMNLGYLLILAQKEHRGIHDLLADTSVIYYHEKKVYVHTQMNYRNMVPQPGYTVPPQGGMNPQSGNSVPSQSGINPQSGSLVSPQGDINPQSGHSILSQGSMSPPSGESAPRQRYETTEWGTGILAGDDICYSSGTEFSAGDRGSRKCRLDFLKSLNKFENACQK